MSLRWGPPVVWVAWLFLGSSLLVCADVAAGPMRSIASPAHTNRAGRGKGGRLGYAHARGLIPSHRRRPGEGAVYAY